MLDLWDVLDLLDVGGVTSSTKDNTHPSCWVDVVRSHKSTCSVVDQGSDLDRNVVLVECFAEHGNDIFAFDTGGTETFRPSEKGSLVDLILPASSKSQLCSETPGRNAQARVGEGEAESDVLVQDNRSVLVLVVILDEGSKTLRAEINCHVEPYQPFSMRSAYSRTYTAPDRHRASARQ